ncbi:hypothetical protein HOLleu_44948 [Holothuria leucospilota]|uniref:Reverse transcriptase domain-containing protein n=1 Tax=Holothuria leucospilota TaxID=206669 RepID=A0A9Q0Y8H7_HOLLE|nr:hypothetical protein HOLleu_44948 [Holothuria leucospilota]
MDDSVESICVEVKFKATAPILIYSVYRPPNSPVSFFNSFSEMLSKASREKKEVVTLGDLNCNVDPSVRDVNARHLRFITDLYQLENIIEIPTRVSETSSTVIDLILTTMKERHKETKVYVTNISDHFLIATVVGTKTQINNSSNYIVYRNFSKLNENSFRNDLQSSGFDDIFSCNNVDHAWKLWWNKFMKVVDIHAPKRSKRVRSRPCPWLSQNLVKMMNERDFYHKKALTTKLPLDWEHYKELRNRVNMEFKWSKKNFLRTKIAKNKNGEDVWNCLKLLIPSNKKSLPANINYGTETFESSNDIANAFNDYFGKIALDIVNHNDEHVHSDFMLPSGPSQMFFLPHVSEEFVMKEVLSMSPGKSTGLDEIGCKVLKTALPVILSSLTYIINLSLKEGVFPQEWKHAKVTPIFKKGDVHDICNYRPISVLPIVSKIIERAVHKALYEYLSKNKLLCDNQSGFRPAHSCETALINMVDTWLENIDKGLYTGIILIDLSKAFDTVNHDILLNKLKVYGCSNHALTWFTSYLSDRKQSVQIKNMLSKCSDIKIGVPQGSILGPLLFTLYINDLPNVLRYGRVDMYADDTTLSVSGGNINDIERKLTVDMAEITKWINKNKLALNVAKTKCMLLTSSQRRRFLDRGGDLHIEINNTRIECVDKVKCLGVMIDKDLLFHEHVSSVSSNCLKKIGLLKKSSSLLDSHHLSMLYNAFILPHLNFCSTVWADKHKGDTSKLSSIQRRCARIISGAEWDTPSSRILNELRWIPIDEQFFFNRSIMMYKILNDISPPYLKRNFTKLQNVHPYCTRRAKQDLVLPRCRTSLYAKSFTVRGTTSWNSINDEIRNSKSVETFKRRPRQDILSKYVLSN